MSGPRASGRPPLDVEKYCEARVYLLRRPDDSAKYAGSKAATDHTLGVVAQRFARHPWVIEHIERALARPPSPDILKKQSALRSDPTASVHQRMVATLAREVLRLRRRVKRLEREAE